MPRATHVLFVCVENSRRSQIAEGFARATGQPSIAAYSAGSSPSGEVDPRTISLMAEKGVALDGHSSKGLEDLPSSATWDYVVSMGCGDACPQLPARQRLSWDLPDPKPLGDDEFRRVRDEIERRVRALVEKCVACAGSL